MPRKRQTTHTSVKLPEDLYQKVKNSPFSMRELIEMGLSSKAHLTHLQLQKEAIKTLKDQVKDERKAHRADLREAEKARQVELRAEQKAHERERTRLIKEALKTKNPIVKLIKSPAPPKAPKQVKPRFCRHRKPQNICKICTLEAIESETASLERQLLTEGGPEDDLPRLISLYKASAVLKREIQSETTKPPKPPKPPKTKSLTRSKYHRWRRSRI